MKNTKKNRKIGLGRKGGKIPGADETKGRTEKVDHKHRVRPITSRSTTIIELASHPTHG